MNLPAFLKQLFAPPPVIVPPPRAPRVRKAKAAKPRAAIVTANGIAKIEKRMYASAKQNRLTMMWQTNNSSADSELVTSLTLLRSRSRALIRDAAYAKRAKTVVVNNVIGSGIGMQAQVMTTRDRLNDRINRDIEDVWSRWSESDSCHTGGTFHFEELERAAMGEVFATGEVFIRKHYTAFGNSKVPYALELIEPERIADQTATLGAGPAAMAGNLFRMGVEVDAYHRPVAYWVMQTHAGEPFLNESGRRNMVERVPADQIVHLRVVDRWPQCRGEPWLHAVVRKLNDMDGYTEAEIVAARGAAAYMGSIETPEGSGADEGETQYDGSQQVELTPGIFEKLAPGEKMQFFAPNRPNSALDPFLRYMLRETAAGVGVSYESLSRDYSQSNYSSSRLALLDDRDLWRTLQLWFIRTFREHVHREWLRQAVLARAVKSISVEEYAVGPEKFETVRFKPRGWSWIDPQKEVEARMMAVRCGFDTITNVIAETASGRDIEDIQRERQREIQMAEQMDLHFDTDVVEAELEAAPAAPKPKPADTEEETPARVFNFGRRTDGG